MKKLMIAASLALVPATAPAQMTPNSMTSPKDFVDTATASDRFEREAARIAQDQSSMPAVRAYAQAIHAAHARTSQELAGVAGQARVGCPDDRLSPGQQKMLAMLAAVPAADFDKVYLQQQAQAHADAKGLMEAYAAAGTQPLLRAAAAKTAPLITGHIAEVHRLQHAM